MKRNPWWTRDFYLKFPILNAVCSELSWMHSGCCPSEEELRAELLAERARLEQVRAPGK
jgi:hypothetical protein